MKLTYMLMKMRLPTRPMDDYLVLIIVLQIANVSSVCRLFAVPGSPAEYKEIVGFREYIRPCAPGTAFARGTCGCVTTFRSSARPECKPEVFIDFKNGIRDVSGNWVYVGYQGTRVRNTMAPWPADGFAGEFHNSQLILWRFSGAPLGPPLKIYFAFIEKPLAEDINGGPKEMLVSNGECGKWIASVQIVFDRNAQTITALVDTKGGVAKTANVTVPYAPAEYKHVTYMYDGKYLSLTVNSDSLQRTSSVHVTGEIKVVQCPLSLGDNEGGKPFYGLLDDFKLWTCMEYDYPSPPVRPTTLSPPPPIPFRTSPPTRLPPPFFPSPNPSNPPRNLLPTGASPGEIITPPPNTIPPGASPGEVIIPPPNTIPPGASPGEIITPASNTIPPGAVPQMPRPFRPTQIPFNPAPNPIPPGASPQVPRLFPPIQRENPPRGDANLPAEPNLVQYPPSRYLPQRRRSVISSEETSLEA